MPPLRSRNATASTTRQPPSCRACRIRKLKCNRQRPCSNCQSRKLDCVYDGIFTSEPARLPVDARAHELPPSVSDNGLLAQNRAMQARVEKLEAAVFGTVIVGTLSRQTDDDSPPITSTIAEENEGATLWLDPGWQQGVDVRLTSPLAHLTDGLQIAILPNDQYTVESDVKLRRIWVPPYERMMLFLGSYEGQMNAIQGILHLPVLRERTKAFYAAIHDRSPVDMGLTALLLAICASVGFWDQKLVSKSISSTSTSSASAFISKQALYAIEYTRLATLTSIEAVQASILLTFHLCHLEGFTSRTRLMHCTAFTMARDLGLHVIDGTNANKPPMSQSKVIEMEVGRRVWWHIASTDWLFAYAGSHIVGVYSIHPYHMAVKRPRNSNLEDFNVYGPDFSRPESESTVVSFHLQRIKLASVCREVTDALAEFSFNSSPSYSQVPHELIRTLDNKFDTLIDSLPPFLRFNPDNLERREIPEDSSLQITSQRALLNLLIYTRRCKLHLPSLTRFKSDSQYTFSRKMCLQSACTVLDVGNVFWLENSRGAFTAYFQFASNLQHIFFATVVLVMDLCINENSDSHHVQRVYKAIELIGEARSSSSMGDIFYKSLTNVLQKYQFGLLMGNHVDAGNDGRSPAMYSSTEESGARSLNPGLQTHEIDQVNHVEHMTNTDPAFDDVWQQFLDAGTSMDVQSWDALLNDLEMRTA